MVAFLPKANRGQDFDLWLQQVKGSQLADKLSDLHPTADNCQPQLGINLTYLERVNESKKFDKIWRKKRYVNLDSRILQNYWSNPCEAELSKIIGATPTKVSLSPVQSN